MLELAQRFARLFAGNTKAHGTYEIVTQKGAKSVGKAKTVSNTVTASTWEDHLLGNSGLGVIPIRENNTCSWGAVDIDCYEGFDIEAFSQQLPDSLVLCRSKSGGAHIYLFCDPPAPASLMRKKLALIARAVNFPTAEIFPKQERLDNGAVGNWINMPYFQSETTTRYGIKCGLSLNTEEFLDLAESKILTLEQLVSFSMDNIATGEDDNEFADAPPCLEYLTKNGFPPGSRNHALFNMGVYAKRKYINGWEDKLFEYNNRFMGPGTYTEVAAIIRSLNRKTYVYKCKEQPICNFCDKVTCNDRAFGLSESEKEEKNRRPCILDNVTEVICYTPLPNSKDEPYWVFKFEDKELEVDLKTANSQKLFCHEYSRVFRRIPLLIKDHKWNQSINKLMDEATEIEQAPDAGPEGQFWIHVESFVNGKAKAKNREEIINGRPWSNGGRVYFRSCDLLKYLDQQRFRYFQQGDIFNILRRRNAEHHNITVKGKGVKCWSIISFDEQTEEFETEFVPMEVDF